MMPGDTIVKAYCIQGTVTRPSGKGTISPQFSTFYLMPDVQGILDANGAKRIAEGILNPTGDKNIKPNVSAVLVTLYPNSTETDNAGTVEPTAALP